MNSNTVWKPGAHLVVLAGMLAAVCVQVHAAAADDEQKVSREIPPGAENTSRVLDLGIIPASDVELGNLERGATTRFQFSFLSPFSSPATVESLNASCSCASLRLRGAQEPVLPDQAFDLEGTIRTEVDSTIGSILFTVNFAEQLPPIRFRCRYHTTAEPSASPARLNFGSAIRSGASRMFTITAVTDVPGIEVVFDEACHCSDPRLKCLLLETDHRPFRGTEVARHTATYQVAVQGIPIDDQEVVESEVVVRIRVGQVAKDIKVPVYGKICPPLESRPDRILIIRRRRDASEAPVVRNLPIFLHPDLADVKHISAVSADPRVDVSFRPAERDEQSDDPRGMVYAGSLSLQVDSRNDSSFATEIHVSAPRQGVRRSIPVKVIEL